MAEYNKAQSTVVALWVLAQQRTIPVRGGTAPDVIADLVNRLGASHSSDSILLHTHGYDRLFFDRPIDKNITQLQREIASELRDAGVVSRVYDRSDTVDSLEDAGVQQAALRYSMKQLEKVARENPTDHEPWRDLFGRYWSRRAASSNRRFARGSEPRGSCRRGSVHAYGMVTVFADLYGNRWDLIELLTLKPG